MRVGMMTLFNGMLANTTVVGKNAHPDVMSQQIEFLNTLHKKVFHLPQISSYTLIDFQTRIRKFISNGCICSLELGQLRCTHSPEASGLQSLFNQHFCFHFIISGAVVNLNSSLQKDHKLSHIPPPYVSGLFDGQTYEDLLLTFLMRHVSSLASLTH